MNCIICNSILKEQKKDHNAPRLNVFILSCNNCKLYLYYVTEDLECIKVVLNDKQHCWYSLDNSFWIDGVLIDNIHPTNSSNEYDCVRWFFKYVDNLVFR